MTTKLTTTDIAVLLTIARENDKPLADNRGSHAAIRQDLGFTPADTGAALARLIAASLLAWNDRHYVLTDDAALAVSGACARGAVAEIPSSLARHIERVVVKRSDEIAAKLTVPQVSALLRIAARPASFAGVGRAVANRLIARGLVRETSPEVLGLTLAGERAARQWNGKR